MPVATALVATALVATAPGLAQEGPDRFRAADLLSGRDIDEQTCAATSQAVWIASVPGGPACIRYYYSEAGGQQPNGLVVLPDDQTVARPGEPRVAVAGYEARSPQSLTAEAEGWSRRYRGPALLLARPGSFGSSGQEEREAGTRREARLMAAALDEIRDRHGLKGFHLAGLGGSGNLTATLALKRSDVACAVVAGAALSEVDRLAANNASFDPATLAATNDPLTELTGFQPRGGLRFFAANDPADPATPAAAVTAFLTAARDHRLTVDAIALAPRLARADLAGRTLQAAISCGLGEPDQKVEAQFGKAAPLQTRSLTQAPPAPAEPPPQPPARLAPPPKVAAPSPQPAQPTPPTKAPSPRTATTQAPPSSDSPPAAPKRQGVQPQRATQPPTPPPPPVASLPQDDAAPPPVTPNPQSQTPPQPQRSISAQPGARPNQAPAGDPPDPRQPTAAPVTKSSPERFSRVALLAGIPADQAACLAIKTAVWVTGIGNPECIRYYYSTAGGTGPRTLLFMNGDFTYRGADGRPTVDAEYDSIGPDDIQHVADVRSRDYGGPMIYLARPGTFGSSGNELQLRHTPREVALVSAAVTEIKRRYNIETMDVIGHSGGGLLLGALISSRVDIGCAASSSGVLATNDWISQRLNIPAPHDGGLYDPLEHVAEIRPGAKFRLLVLTDILDLRVSPLTTQIYLDALQARGIPFQHYRLTAQDDAHHDLALHAFRAAIACAHGASDQELSDLLLKTVVTNPRMSEMGPIGDMPKPGNRSSAPNAPQPQPQPPSPQPAPPNAPAQPQPQPQPRAVPPQRSAPQATTPDDADPPESKGHNGGGRPVAGPRPPGTDDPTAPPRPQGPKAAPPPQKGPPSTSPQQQRPRTQTPDDTAIPIRSDERYSTRDLLAGVPVSVTECGRKGTAVLVVVDARPECIRYFISGTIATGREAVFYLPWDQVLTPQGQKPIARDGYEDVLPADLMSTANTLSDGFKRPFIFLSRPGTLGSSGKALDLQHTEREVAVTMAALDAIKRRIGAQKIHLIGQGGGGLLVAAAVAARSDIGCAVIASGFLSVKDGYRQGVYGPTNASLGRLYDPQEHVAELQTTGLTRLIALQDPEDSVSPLALQDSWVDAVKAAGKPILALREASFAEDHHDLSVHGLRAALGCLDSATDQEITEYVARTPSPDHPNEPPAEKPADKPPEKPAVGPMTMAHDPLPRMSPSEEPHFSAAELVSGKRADRAECEATKDAVWLVVEGRGDCIRYYLSTAGGTKPTAMVFMNGDMVVSGGPSEMLAARPGYDTEKPSDLVEIADAWSRAYGGPAIYLARPGTFGSSGREIVDRRSNREVLLISGALDEIRRRLSLTSFDITGQSGGGHLVAAMLTKRNDIRCAVVSSGVLAVKDNEELRGRRHRPSDFDRIFDPILHLAEFVDRPEQRLFILNDPLDQVVTPRSTENFIKALMARNFPFQHIEGKAGDPEHHGLAIHGLRATIACAHGQTDASIARVVAATEVSHPMMSEMGTMGDMDVPKTK